MIVTTHSTFAGARLLTFIAPKFAYDGSAPPWMSVHVGDFTIPPRKTMPREAELRLPEPTPEEESRIEFDSPKSIHVAANPHKFEPASYTMGADVFVPIPHIGMPKTPQPRPAALPNADLYQKFHIPSIRRGMTAKTRVGQRRFHEWRDSVFQQRKALFAAGEQLLREAEFQGDHVDRRAYCVQCGASFFERKSGKLRCRDCRWEMDESLYVEREQRTKLVSRERKRKRKHVRVQH